MPGASVASGNGRRGLPSAPTRPIRRTSNLPSSSELIVGRAPASQSSGMVASVENSVAADTSARLVCGARSLGSSRQPKLRNTKPTRVSASPTGAKSNIWNGAPSSSSRTWLAMMLVEVPTSVTSPPSSEMNAIGISSAEAEESLPRPMRIATGIIVASAPTFFVTIANSPVTAVRTGTCVRGVVRRAAIGRSSGSITWLRLIAALTTSAEAMMMTTSLANPSNAALGATSPSTTAAARTTRLTRS